MKSLAITEKQRLQELETVISNGIQTFYEIGKALYEIRESRLYRETHDTFEEYCKDRWDMSKPYATQVIGATKVRNNLVAIATVLPQTESQARPLTKLEPEQQKEAWEKVVETAPEGKITAKIVSKVVSQITKNNIIKEVEKKKKKAITIPKEEIVDEDFKRAFDDFYREVQRVRLDNWETTSKQAASLLVKLIQDLIEVE